MKTIALIMAGLNRQLTAFGGNLSNSKEAVLADENFAFGDALAGFERNETEKPESENAILYQEFEIDTGSQNGDPISKKSRRPFIVSSAFDFRNGNSVEQKSPPVTKLNIVAASSNPVLVERKSPATTKPDMVAAQAKPVLAARAEIIKTKAQSTAAMSFPSGADQIESKNQITGGTNKQAVGEQNSQENSPQSNSGRQKFVGPFTRQMNSLNRVYNDGKNNLNNKEDKTELPLRTMKLNYHRAERSFFKSELRNSGAQFSPSIGIEVSKFVFEQQPKILKTPIESSLPAIGSSIQRFIGSNPTDVKLTNANPVKLGAIESAKDSNPLRTLELQLVPKSLGIVEIKIAQSAGKMKILIETKSIAAENAIRTELSSIHEACKAAGIVIDELTVRTNHNLEQSDQNFRQNKTVLGDLFGQGQDDLEHGETRSDGFDKQQAKNTDSVQPTITANDLDAKYIRDGLYL